MAATPPYAHHQSHNPLMGFDGTYSCQEFALLLIICRMSQDSENTTVFAVSRPSLFRNLLPHYEKILKFNLTKIIIPSNY